MQIWATDPEWFDYLKARPDITEINFWRPGNQPVRLPRGTPWFFQLRGMRSFVGCAFFSTFTSLPIGVAWDTFGKANGFDEFSSFRAKMAELQRVSQRAVHDIGCAVLSNPIYFDEPIQLGDRLYGPRSSTPSDGPIAQALLAAIRRTEALSAIPRAVLAFDPGKPRIIVPRAGQATFRVLVTQAYSRRCALTGERTLPALEAAHIKPYALVREHDVRNGLLLRSDLHKLFDDGYVGVRPDLTVCISKAIREEFANGRDYYALDGRAIRLPEREADAPDRTSLEWHYETIFKG